MEVCVFFVKSGVYLEVREAGSVFGYCEHNARQWVVTIL